MTNENNDVFTMEDEPIASVMQDIRRGLKQLSAFLESYRPPPDGGCYLTGGEVSGLLRVSRRTLQEYRNNRVLSFILLEGKVLYLEAGLHRVLEVNHRKPLERGGFMKEQTSDTLRGATRLLALWGMCNQ